MHKNEVGTIALNEKLQALLNPGEGGYRERAYRSARWLRCW